MATLTYNPSEQAEGELNAEEQEALEVGEKQAEQQGELLAGKFKDAEALEQGYIELQKKLGSPEEKAEETTAEVKEEEVKEEQKEVVDSDFLNKLWDEGVAGEYSKETIQQLESMDSRSVAKMYLEYRANNQQPEPTGLTDDNVKDLKAVVGSDGEYDNMMRWASDSLGEKEIKMYDAVMDKGDPLAAFFAVQALAYRYNDAKGVDGEMLQGKATKSEGDTFKSQAQVVKAMSDPQYDKDPAYRQAIYDKLERSNLQF